MGLKHMPLLLFSSLLSAWHKTKLWVVFLFHVTFWEVYVTENVMGDSRDVYVSHIVKPVISGNV